MLDIIIRKQVSLILVQPEIKDSRVSAELMLSFINDCVNRFVNYKIKLYNRIMSYTTNVDSRPR